MPSIPSRTRLIGMAIGTVLLVAAGVFLFTYTPPEPEPRPPVVRPAKTLTLETAAQAATRSYTGRVEATRQVDLSFRVSGPLIELSVKGADDVVEGQVLARIDPRDFEVMLRTTEAQLDAARASLSAMEAGARPQDLERLRADVQRAEAAVGLAESEYESFKAARADNAVSELQYQQKVEARDRAAALLRSARESLSIGEQGARQEDILAKQAEIRALEAARDAAADQLSDTELVAPFTGRVARTYVENFQDVRSKEPILSLQDVSTVEVVADIPGSVVAVTHRDVLADFIAVFDYFPEREFVLEFVEAEIAADPRTRTYPVTFAMPAPEDVNILPGMSATVRVTVDAAANAAPAPWLVPADALFADEAGAHHVWRVDVEKMTVHSVPVVPGELRGGRIEIVGGLAAGDTIVIAGVRLLQEGMRIRNMEVRAQ